MAKRYTRINWKNDATTALGATLLNKMDKGIKDCDDAIGDLALLNTTNKDDLVKAVNELLVAINTLNNNLANCVTLNGDKRLINPIADLNNFNIGIGLFCSDNVANTPDDGWWMIVAAGDGGTAVQIAYALSNNVLPQTRRCASGTWSNWELLKLA